jgi:hypothetical protein
VRRRGHHLRAERGAPVVLRRERDLAAPETDEAAAGARANRQYAPFRCAGGAESRAPSAGRWLVQRTCSVSGMRECIRRRWYVPAV